MIGSFFSEMGKNQKVSIAKYAAVFVGGLAVGFAISKAMDSPIMDDIKSSATAMFNDYANPQVEIEVVPEEHIDDEENEE